ncbi:MAG: hypothetical protein FWG87_01795 [Defluviitaleaceae bacterium]|nr:hypothetical protein [Defluviitaleaceae bacterium]
MDFKRMERRFSGFPHEPIRVIRENPLNPCPIAVYSHMNVSFNPKKSAKIRQIRENPRSMPLNPPKIHIQQQTKGE